MSAKQVSGERDALHWLHLKSPSGDVVPLRLDDVAADDDSTSEVTLPGPDIALTLINRGGLAAKERRGSAAQANNPIKNSPNPAQMAHT